MKSWDRLQWGVAFTGSLDEQAILIGATWAREFQTKPYPGEPTRALLFCTRKQARDWCLGKMAQWRDGREKTDPVCRWRVFPVRVREVVEPC